MASGSRRPAGRGILRRVCIVEDEQGEIIELINPEIIKTEGEQTGLEGCLSVPRQRGIVTDAPDAVVARARAGPLRHGV
ncbi:MAG: peptide deformylase [Oscillibacter sp.]